MHDINGVSNKIDLKGLEEITYAIAGKINEESNEAVLDEIRFHVRAETARLKKQYLEKNGMHPNFMQQFRVPLVARKEIDDYARNRCVIEPAILDKCVVLRSEDEVPHGFRIGNIPFHSVMTGRGRTISYAPKEDVRFLSDTKFGQPAIFYEYIDKYLYVFNTTVLQEVYIRHAFDNPEELLHFEDCQNCDPVVDLGLPSDYVSTLIENVLNLFRIDRMREDVSIDKERE